MFSLRQLHTVRVSNTALCFLSIKFELINYSSRTNIATMSSRLVFAKLWCQSYGVLWFSLKGRQMIQVLKPFIRLIFIETASLWGRSLFYLSEHLPATRPQNDILPLVKRHSPLTGVKYSSCFGKMGLISEYFDLSEIDTMTVRHGPTLHMVV